MRVLFLDIDGVLNSTASCIAFNGYPHDFTPSGLNKFDHVAIALIRKLCKVGNVKVVLSSTWRLEFTPEQTSDGLGIPCIDRTKSLPGTRGVEINEWLSRHPEVEVYAIVDDNSDMLPEQMERFVQTHMDDGLTLREFRKLCALFGINEYAQEPELLPWA